METGRYKIREWITNRGAQLVTVPFHQHSGANLERIAPVTVNNKRVIGAIHRNRMSVVNVGVNRILRNTQLVVLIGMHDILRKYASASVDGDFLRIMGLTLRNTSVCSQNKVGSVPFVSNHLSPKLTLMLTTVMSQEKTEDFCVDHAIVCLAQPKIARIFCDGVQNTSLGMDIN